MGNNEEVSRIWREYHKLLTGSDEIRYDEHGNLFGFIAKLRPLYQTEILYLMYNAGYAAGMEAAEKAAIAV